MNWSSIVDALKHYNLMRRSKLKHRKEISALRQLAINALDKYGRHFGECGKWQVKKINTTYTCTCGLSGSIQELSKRKVIIS